MDEEDLSFLVNACLEQKAFEILVWIHLYSPLHVINTECAKLHKSFSKQILAVNELDLGMP